MTEILVVTALGLLALTVGAMSAARVNSSGRHRRRERAESEPAFNDGEGSADGFDPTADAGCGDAGGDGGGGGGCD